MNYGEYLQNPNIKAFLWLIRTGEGTTGEFGYRTHYGGSLFESFSDHPRKAITAGSWTSTAAGAYQFLSKTWDGLVKQYGFSDFSPENQDKAAIRLIEGRGALVDVIAGRIESAIRKCNKEWASLPESPYGQPTLTMYRALEVYRVAGGYFRPAGTLAPVEDKSMVAPFVAAVLPSLVQAVPDLIRIFGSSPQAEKNAKAAEIVVNAAKVATGAVNEQDLVEKIKSADPETLVKLQEAVKEVWFDISVDPSGIKDAREFNLKSDGFYKQPAFWITVMLMPLVYGVAGSVLGWFGAAVFTQEVKIMVVSSVMSGVLGGIMGFWMGTSWSSHRKTELGGR